MVNTKVQGHHRGHQGHHTPNKQLLCAVCCQAYNAGQRDPVELPRCGHTFCRLCLFHLQGRQQNFPCPLCRTQHCGPPVERMPVNFLAISLLETMGQVESDESSEEYPAGEVCGTHGAPLLLWCRQCRQVLCAKCLSQQQHAGHTLHELQAVLAEKKSHIEEEARHRLRDLEKEKQKLTREVESVVSTLSRIYKKSEALGRQMQRVENIRKVTTDTDNLQTVANLELALHRLPKPGSLPQEPTLEDKYNNFIAEDEGSKTNDNEGGLKTWPLIMDVAGGGRHWPIIPWQHFTAQVPALQLLVPSPAPEVFLQLEVAGVVLGRVHIRLWGHLRRAHHFLALCLGTFGPSYKGAKFRTVERRGEPGESLRGGDYPATDGSGTMCRGVMAELEWGGQHAGPVRKGVVGGGGGGCHESDALFNICLRDKPHGKMSCPFGEVVSGLSVVSYAAYHHPLTEVTISAAGLVLPPY